jgi:hypothetical protein
MIARDDGLYNIPTMYNKHWLLGTIIVPIVGACIFLGSLKSVSKAREGGILQKGMTLR